MDEKAGWKNKLFFGDNLGILREEVHSESVDLVYLDPPFNSNATYNVLFGGKRPELPRFAPSATFKKAPKKVSEDKKQGLF